MRQQRQASLAIIEKKAHTQPPCRGFAAALRRQETKVAFIAEMKRASPSAGLLRQDYEPAQLAAAYATNGAACLSVLTNRFFEGDDEDLIEARAAVTLPVLRKDFIVDDYQVYETRAMGADAILLIVACLADEELIKLQDLAWDLGLDVLVEVHSEDEMERALNMNPQLIGVNNRNLNSFETRLEVGERLLPLVDKETGTLAIAESGIKSAADVRRLAACGAQAFLVGETLMRAPMPGDALAALQRGL